MAYEYKASAKYQLALRFKTDDDAREWVVNADEEVLAGVERRRAEDWVDMCIDSEDELKKFVNLAVTWSTVEYFEVYKY